MTQQLIDIGGQPNDGTGDSIRTAFEKTNLNFTEIFTGNFLSYLPVELNADNIKNGVANQIPVQVNESTTAFINAPVNAETFLKWNGSSFVWDYTVAPSDIRFKNNVQEILNPLEKIEKIRGVSFTWSNNYIEKYGSIPHFQSSDIGVIAQEIEEVLPEIVLTNEDGYKFVQYDKIVALLIEVTKAQNTKIKILEEKINFLENNIN